MSCPAMQRQASETRAGAGGAENCGHGCSRRPNRWLHPRHGWCGALGERVRRDVVVSEEHGKKVTLVKLLAAVGSRPSHLRTQVIGGPGRCIARPPLYVAVPDQFPAAALPPRPRDPKSPEDRAGLPYHGNHAHIMTSSPCVRPPGPVSVRPCSKRGEGALPRCRPAGWLTGCSLLPFVVVDVGVMSEV